MFKNNIKMLYPNINRKFELVGTPIEITQDFIYLAKLREIIARYESARFMLLQTKPKEWDYWTKLNKTEETKEYCKVIVKSNFYESALIFYNIVVELSWQLTYLSIENFLINTNDNIVSDLSGLKEKDDAVNLIRQLEELCKEPSDQLYSYLLKIDPTLDEIIEIIRRFKDKVEFINLKLLYNFTKHRGKFKYKEMFDFEDLRFHTTYSFNSEGDITTLNSSSEDLFKTLNLEEAINELFYFDDEILFPYLKQLIYLLFEWVQPSPFAF